MKPLRDVGPPRLGWAAWACLALFGLSACDQVDQIQNEIRDLTPHEAYMESLRAVNLTETALGTQWASAAVRSLSDAPVITLPFEEDGFLFAETPEARSYRVELRRGQRLSIEAGLEGGDRFRFFIDVYRMPGDATDDPLPVLSTEFDSERLEYISTRRAEYVVRLQPELLRGGRYHIALRVEGSIAFPVEERDTRAVLSFFGDSRDGGSRDHHGVDIFAPRGTPVLSATNGRVSRVRTTPIGGKVVWVNDSEEPNRVYYAHLDSQVVRDGMDVKRGTLLGFVGNTGNARTTPPHLHFGLYRRPQGPMDPWYFLYQPSQVLPDASAPLEHLGVWTRTVNAGIRLREGPSSRAEVVAELEESTPLRVLAASGPWYHVRLPDGRDGFVAARLTEAVVEPLRSQFIKSTSALVSAPSPVAPVMEDVEAGTEVAVLGSYEGFLYVQSPDGSTGWLAGEAEL
jgi:murein DD-endopeptidase MepM/ murein hydrolase activator NlpD/SH3-like domain-containing protein